MSRTFVAIAVFSLLAVLSFSARLANAQEKTVAPPAPVPAQLLTAKRVFVSNGGLDGLAFQAFHKLGDVNQPYNAFYAALNSWGRYSLVAAPAEADLVFEIRFTAPFNGDEHVPSYVPQLNLTIYDAKTRFVLWTILAPVEGAFRKTTFIKNVNQGITDLMASLKGLEAGTVNSAAASAK
jgi:hypothetical protein